MPYNRYIQISKERYDEVCERYIQFVKDADNLNKEPPKVFHPLSKKQMEELELIREVSKELMMKKNDDMKKAAQQAQEAEEKAAEIAAKEIKDTAAEETPAEA